MSPTLAAFQSLCHEYYTCYVLAADGMENLVATLPVDPQKYPDQKIYIGHKGPAHGPAQSVMSATKAAASARRDGQFPDIIAKALLIRIYAEWDEHYRKEVARELAVDAKCVQCDLMGDLRRIRNWIVHAKSTVENDVAKICILPWKLTQGDVLGVTSEMFRQFADCINGMDVKIETKR